MKAPSEHLHRMLDIIPSMTIALHGDWAAALQTMQFGIASAEYGAFVEQLKQKAQIIRG